MTRDEHKAIDSTADAAPSETTGAAVAAGPDVQLVDAEQLNDIDRKADVGPTSANPERSDAPTNSEQANASWMQWLWSVLGSTFAALATAVHQLVRT